jgi:hypothetical protein
MSTVYNVFDKVKREILVQCLTSGMTVKCASFYPYIYFPEITNHDRRYLHIYYTARLKGKDV